MDCSQILVSRDSDVINEMSLSRETSQILPGAVDLGPCSLSTGYFLDKPFIVSNVVFTQKIVFSYCTKRSERTDYS